MSARTTAARVAALQKGQYAPGVTELLVPGWRGVGGLLANNDKWVPVRGVRFWLYYVEDLGALGPLEVLFDSAGAMQDTEGFTDNASLGRRDGPVVPRGLVIHPGTFVRLPAEGTTIYVRAHAASLTASTISASREGATAPASANLDVNKFPYANANYDVKPRLVTGDDAWLVAQAGSRMPDSALAPAIMAHTAYSGVAAQTMFWNHATLPDNGNHGVPHPDVLFPRWLRSHLNQARVHLLHSTTAALATATAADQRVPTLATPNQGINNAPLVWGLGSTLQGAIAQTVIEMPDAWDFGGGSNNCALVIGATGRSLSDAGRWYGALRLQRGPERHFHLPTPVRSAYMYNTAFNVAAGEARVFMAPGAPSFVWNTRTIVTANGTNGGFRDMHAPPGVYGVANTGTSTPVIMTETAVAFTNLGTRSTSMNAAAGLPEPCLIQTRGSMGILLTATTGTYTFSMLHAEGYHLDNGA